jgi:uncharacterized membrane-anchored protein
MTAITRRPLRTVLAGALCLAILSGMMALHAWPLWTGQAMLLPVVPLDPRAPFHGEYVLLDTPSTKLRIADGASAAGNVPDAAVVAPVGTWWSDLGGDRPARSRALRTKVVYVQFEARGTEHQAVSISDRPIAGARNLRGRVSWFDVESGDLMINYGVSRYYMQEGKAGPVDEALRRQRRVQMELAVTPSGRARIRHVLVDGVPL